MKTKNQTPTVQNLRKSGNKVRIIHYRNYFVPAQNFLVHVPRGENVMENVVIDVKPKLMAKSGKTLIELDTPEGKYYRSEVFCSKKDHFCKKRAVNIGIARIIKQMKINGEVI